MFNADFFPTPVDVISAMISMADVEGKVILEPHVGSGNLVKAMKAFGAKEVIGCEKDPELYKISSTYCKMIGTDFLQVTSDQISHIQMIIMNPPFSTGGRHILHAYKIAPDGCKIIALCNYETIANPHTIARQELVTLIDTHGTSTNLGDCFSDAERKTNVEVALVKIQKPFSMNRDQEFEGFFEDEDPEEQQSNGLMSYNAVRDLVNRYVKSIKIYDEQLETAVRLNAVMGSHFEDVDKDARYDQVRISVTFSEGGVPMKREEFKKRLQKSGWRWIFKTMDINKYSTKGLKEDINKFVEEQQKIPFTMRNIYKMLEIVVATTSQRMDKAIMEVFDKVTRHTNDNRYGVEGFKTNSDYLLTKKFIFTYACEMDYNNEFVRLRRHQGDCETLMDMEKALCFITGKNWDEIKGIWHLEKMIAGEWYDTSFFRVKGFKKGTIHVEFNDENVWALFNQHIGRIKGFIIPEKKEKTAYQKRQTYERPVESMA